MRTTIHLALAVAAILAAAPAYGGEVDLPRYPSISPDGSEIVFSWRGDLWGVSSQGGHATRLTAHKGDELRSAWSPDGNTVAFDSDRSGWSNLWVMDAGGGGVRQVTFEDTGCVLSGWSPDGRRLLFHASREGDVYREPRPYQVAVDPDFGLIRRVHDAHGRAPRMSPGGAAVAFTRGGSSWNRRGYRGPGARDVWVRREAERAGTPFVRITTWDGNDGLPRWQDANRLLYLSDRDLETVNVWRQAPQANAAAERLTSFQGTDVTWLDVSADGGTAVLAAWDRIYTLDLRTPGAAPRALTITAARDRADDTFVQDVGSDTSEAALNPDGKSVACVAYGELFVRGVEKESPTLRVTADHARDKDAVWSPDGMSLYFVSDRAGHDGIYVARVTETREDIRKALLPEPAKETDGEVEEEEPESEVPKEDDDGDQDDGEPESDEEEKAESKKKDDVPGPDRWADAVSFTVEPLLVDEHANRGPQPSPDGTQILFRRGLGDLCVLDVETKAVRVLSPGWDTGLGYRWSPDGRHVAFHRNDRDFNQDIWIVPSDGSADAVNISRHPDDDFGPRWSADGKVLAFTSSRWDDQSDVYVVFLDRDLESMTDLERKRHFEEVERAAKKRKPLPPPGPEEESKNDDDTKATKPDEPPALDLVDAYRRVRRVTTGPEGEYAAALVPSGERIVYSDGKTLRSIQWDGTDDKQLRGSSTSVQGLSLKGDKIVFVAGGKPGLVSTGGGGEELLPLAAKIELRHDEAAEQRFREAAGVVGEVFYHPTMKGRDWPALTERYLELARRARTPGEFDAVAARLLGELNASHLGIRSPRPDAPQGVPNGWLGIDLSDELSTIDRVLPDGPADRGPLGLRRGDQLVSVDGAEVSPDAELAPLLRGTVGREIVVEVERSGEDGQVANVRILLTPISAGAERELRYQDWVRRNAEHVAELSNGRVGYVHIRGMNRSSLRVFERELYAAMDGRDGLIVDVRNNGGGSTADLVLASLMVRPHAYTVPRGADQEHKDGYPEDRLYIQRFTGPVNMLCNEKSFSNAEIVSHAFKTLGRGTLVGEQTYGGVISTGGYRLVDGTFVRTPFRGWYLPDGTDMENNGAMPDVRVPADPQNEIGREFGSARAQLVAAVRDLLPRLPR